MQLLASLALLLRRPALLDLALWMGQTSAARKQGIDLKHETIACQCCRQAFVFFQARSEEQLGQILTQEIDAEGISNNIVGLLEGNIRNEEEGEAPGEGPSV